MTEWKRVKIGEVCRIEKGATGIASATPGDYPLVVTALERKTCSTYQFDCEAVCIPLVSSSGHGKKSLKYVHYQNGKFALGTILAAVIPKDKNELSARYLHQYLQFYKDTMIVPLMHGAANVSLAIRDIEQIEIPLPPIEKQNDFAKLFVRLQENDVELQSEFETQKDLIKKLRQSIFQDAIEGKLTEDWRKENPLKKGDINFDAEALFEKIQDEKSKQEKGNKKKKDNGKLQVIGDDEKPFEIPESWKWVKLENCIIKDLGGGTPSKSKPEYWNGVIPWMTVKDYSYNNSLYINDTIDHITELGLKNSSSNMVEKNNIIICVRMGLGKIAINKTALAINQDLRAVYLSEHIVQNFFVYFYKTLSINGSGMTVKGIKKDELFNYLFPLPPLAEQNEIVRRVETKLAKVEQLEQQVQERETLTKSLFRGILKNAFGGRG